MEIFPNLFNCCKKISRKSSFNQEVTTQETKENKPENLSVNIKVNSEKEPSVNQSKKDIHLSNNNLKIDQKRTSKFSNNSMTSQVTFSNMKVKESFKSNSFIDTEIMNKHELVLSGELFWNKDIVIDCLGLKMGKRKKKEGVTVFGTGAAGPSISDYNNDFVINIKNSEYNKNTSSFFTIEYDKPEEKFYITKVIKDVNISHIIDYEYFLDFGIEQFFLIGKIRVDILLSAFPENQNHIKISFKVYDTNNNISNYDFTEKDTPISIGRSNCRINIKNNSISKIHAAIDFSNDYKRYYIKDMGSTNGTFYSLEYKKRLKLTGEMKFKLFDMKFSISECE